MPISRPWGYSSQTLRTNAVLSHQNVPIVVAIGVGDNLVKGVNEEGVVHASTPFKYAPPHVFGAYTSFRSLLASLSSTQKLPTGTRELSVTVHSRGGLENEPACSLLPCTLVFVVTVQQRQTPSGSVGNTFGPDVDPSDISWIDTKG